MGWRGRADGQKCACRRLLPCFRRTNGAGCHLHAKLAFSPHHCRASYLILPDDCLILDIYLTTFLICKLRTIRGLWRADEETKEQACKPELHLVLAAFRATVHLRRPWLFHRGTCWSGQHDFLPKITSEMSHCTKKSATKQPQRGFRSVG